MQLPSRSDRGLSLSNCGLSLSVCGLSLSVCGLSLSKALRQAQGPATGSGPRDKPRAQRRFIAD